MLCKDFNIEETHKYLTQDLHLIISIKAIREIYSAIRYVLYKYFYIYYQSEYLATKNAHQNITIDESMFCHFKNGVQIWVLGAINTYTKEFRLEACKVRNGETLKKFICKFIEECNHIKMDG